MRTDHGSDERATSGGAVRQGGGLPSSRSSLDPAAAIALVDALTLAFERDAESGRFLYVTRYAEEVFRYPLARWRAPRFWEDVLLHPGDRARSLAEHEEALRERRDRTSEYRVRTADGRVLFVRESVRAVPGPSGLVLRGIFTDITEQKRAEQLAEERRRRLEGILDRAGEGIYGIDARGRITFVNPSAAEMLGYSPEELIGRSEHELVHGPLQHRANGTCAIQAVLTTGEPRSVRGDRFVKKDGSAFVVDYTSTPIRENRRVTGAVVMFRDVSGRDAVERELSRREQQLARVQRLAALGAWEWDVTTDRVHWSDELYAILGVAPGSLEASFEGYRRMIYPADREELDAAVRRALEHKEGYHLEQRVVRPDGEVRSVRAVCDVTLDARGEVVKLQGFLQDVTAQLEAERRKLEILRARFAQEEARTAEKRVREVLEAIPQQVWVIDAEGAVLMVNERVSAYFAVTIDRIGSDAVREAIHPDDYERALVAWRDARARCATFSIEVRLRRATDHVYRWHLCRAEPQLAPDGTVERWIGTNTDLQAVREAQAERARAEREARLERKRLRTIFERAPASICITRGPEHALVAANAAFRALLPAPDATHRPLSDAFPELIEQGVGALLDRVHESGLPYVGREIPIRYSRPDSRGASLVYFNLVLSPLADQDGEVEGVLLHAMDVTDMVYARLAVEDKAAELEELTRHLEAANEELDRFAYVTSHDLRAPLRGISNLANWIEEDLRDDANEETRQHLVLLRGRVSRLEHLIDGILRYSRAGRRAAELEEVDLGRLIEEVLDLLDPPADAIIEPLGRMPVLVTERVPLAQVLQNLIDNALRHGRGADGARVEIAVEQRDEGWSFAVRDHGPGIDPRFHDRIWGIFQTLGADAGGEGTGIGLSLVRKIVETRGGQVWIESRVGEGATFGFTWPEQRRARRAPSTTMAVVGAPAARQAGGG